jgi:hypothetical protein
MRDQHGRLMEGTYKNGKIPRTVRDEEESE